MELTVLERLMLLNVLPKEADFLSLKTLRSLREALSEALAADVDAKNLTRENDQFHWKTEVVKEIEITPRARQIIYDRLKELDKQKKLTDNHFSLCEKFLSDA